MRGRRTCAAPFSIWRWSAAGRTTSRSSWYGGGERRSNAGRGRARATIACLALFRVAQPCEPLLDLGDFRLQLGIGVLPEVEELCIVRRGVLLVPFRVVQLAEPLVTAGKLQPVNPKRPLEAIGVAGEHGDRRIGLPGQIVGMGDVRQRTHPAETRI